MSHDNNVTEIFRLISGLTYYVQSPHRFSLYDNQLCCFHLSVIVTSVCVFYMYLLIAIFVWTGMIILKILCCPQCYPYVAKLQLLYLCLSLYSVKCTSISFCSVPVCSFWLKCCCFFLCKMFYMCSFHNEFVVNKFACCILSVLKVLWAGLPNIFFFFLIQILVFSHFKVHWFVEDHMSMWIGPCTCLCVDKKVSGPKLMGRETLIVS